MAQGRRVTAWQYGAGLAYDITGDEKYLEPIRLSAAYAKKHGGDLTAKIHKLTPGTPEWVAIVLKGARDVIADLEYDMARRRGEVERAAD